MKTTFTGKSALRTLLCLAGLLCFVFTAPQARADEPDRPADQPADQADPPSRAARISFIEGTVSFQPGGNGDWGAAAKNRPTTVGDKLWTDKDSRAELQTGPASIHMGSMTALSFLNLDENIMQVRIAEGAINFRVRELREGDLYEVDTPNLAFTVKQAGAFRVDVNENGDATRVTALRGEGEVTAGGKTYPVRAGEQAEFTGTDNPEYKVSSAPGSDDLDRWASERDLREDNSTSARYVSRDVPGYSDLDDNGSWREDSDNGAVWYPNSVPVGWAPYSYGAWNWVGPWGWSWVGYEPMAGGALSVVRGAGAQDRSTRAPSSARHSSDFSADRDSVSGSALAEVSASAGSRWVSASRFSRASAAAGDSSTTSTFATRRFGTSTCSTPATTTLTTPTRTTFAR